MSKQFNIRLPERTKQQIQELVKASGYRSQAELVMMLVDREYEKEIKDERDKRHPQVTE